MLNIIHGNLPRLLPLLAALLLWSGCGSSSTQQSRLTSVQTPPAQTPYEEKPSIFYYDSWGHDNERIMLEGLKRIIRVDLSSSNIESINRYLAAYKSALDSVHSQIPIAEGYLARHPSADLSAVLEKVRTDFDRYKSEYEALVIYFGPYKAEYVVEAQRAAVKNFKFRELVLSFVKLKGIPQESVLDSAECVFYVDSAVLKNGKLTLHSHLSILPNNKLKVGDSGGYMDSQYSEIAFLQVHAFVNGQSLGHVKSDSDAIFYSGNFKAGQRFEYTHLINVEDISIPPIGILDLSVDGGEYVNGKIRVHYSGSEQHALGVGNTIVIQGRRDGNHLFMPVRFRVGGQDLTRECLVDTGASITTVPKSILQIETKEEQRFSTANGEVTLPVADSSVTVGDIEKDIKIALSPDDSVALLGANFFAGYLYTIDLENHAIYLIKQ